MFPVEPPTQAHVSGSPTQGGTSPGRPNRPLILAIAVVTVLAVCAAIALVLALHHRGHHTGQQADNPLPSASESAGEAILNRQVDSKNLTVNEIFPYKTMTAGKAQYPIQGSELLNSCAEATYGQPLRDALNSYECSGVVRATIRDQPFEYVGTIAVADVADSAGAAEINDLLNDPQSNGGFLVKNAGDVTVNHTQHRIADSKVYGHFVLVVIVAKRDPNSTFDARDSGVKNFMRDSFDYMGNQLSHRES